MRAMAMLVVLMMLAGVASAAPAREVLTEPKVVDVWPGQSAGQAVLEVQRTVDTAGWDVVIRLHAGVHTPVVATGALVGGGQLVIDGEPGVVIDGGVGVAVSAYRGATVLLGDVDLRGQAGAILAADRSRVQVGRRVVVAASGIQIKAATNSSVSLAHPYVVTAGGAVHLQAQGHSTVSVQGAPTFGAVAYSGAVLVATQGEVLFTGGFGGQPSGVSADIRYGSLLYTAGAPLPGTIPPVVVDGGVWR